MHMHALVLIDLLQSFQIQISCGHSSVLMTESRNQPDPLKFARWRFPDGTMDANLPLALIAKHAFEEVFLMQGGNGKATKVTKQQLERQEIYGMAKIESDADMLKVLELATDRVLFPCEARAAFSKVLLAELKGVLKDEWYNDKKRMKKRKKEEETAEQVGTLHSALPGYGTLFACPSNVPNEKCCFQEQAKIAEKKGDAVCVRCKKPKSSHLSWSDLFNHRLASARDKVQRDLENIEESKKALARHDKLGKARQRATYGGDDESDDPE